MIKPDKLIRSITIVLGLTSIVFFIFDYFLFSKLKPKMVHFEAISSVEEGLMNIVGVGLLLLLGFLLLSLLQLARFLRKGKKITLFLLILVISAVLSFIFIFSDIALLSDIGKQYKHGLSQPEWQILFPIMGFQFITAAVLTYAHVFKINIKTKAKYVAKDSNIFLVVQYIGAVCGLMGLSLSSLGFLYPRAWKLEIHTIFTLIILFLPYVLAVIYWFMVKLQEKSGSWYDEKQLLDVGKSAFLTLLLSVGFMTILFILNFNSLSGIVSIIWLPLYLFFALFVFSLGNLYFNGRA